MNHRQDNFPHLYFKNGRKILQDDPSSTTCNINIIKSTCSSRSQNRMTQSFNDTINTDINSFLHNSPHHLYHHHRHHKNKYLNNNNNNNKENEADDDNNNNNNNNNNPSATTIEQTNEIDNNKSSSVPQQQQQQNQMTLEQSICEGMLFNSRHL